MTKSRACLDAVKELEKIAEEFSDNEKIVKLIRENTLKITKMAIDDGAILKVASSVAPVFIE